MEQEFVVVGAVCPAVAIKIIPKSHGRREGEKLPTKRRYRNNRSQRRLALRRQNSLLRQRRSENKMSEEREHEDARTAHLIHTLGTFPAE